MEERYKSSPADDALISDRSADEVDRSGAMGRIAFDGIERLEPEIAAQLDDPSEMIRGEAIGVLLSWWHRDAYLKHALEMLRSEPDEFVRGHAAGALGGFIQRRPNDAPVEPDQRDLVFTALIRAFLEDPSDHVQETAYCELYEVLTGRRAALPEHFNPERDVDWELLAPYVPANRVPPVRPRPAPVSSEADEALLWDETASPEALIGAIKRLEADRRYEVAWSISRLQSHESPVVRGRALLALTRTWRHDDFGLAREMLESDPEWEARVAAAEAFPYLLQGLPQCRDRFREMLVEALIRENDDRVEAAIREAIEKFDDPAFPGR